MKNCVYCAKELPEKKVKYCNELCKYRYLSMKKDTATRLSIAQQKRMHRAGAAQRKGKLGVRYN